MFCTKCGQEIESGANFCTKCGAAFVASNPMMQRSPNVSIYDKGINFLFVLSIISMFIYLSICIIMWLPNQPIIAWATRGFNYFIKRPRPSNFFLYGIPFVQSCLALYLSLKSKKRIITVMSIVSILFYVTWQFLTYEHGGPGHMIYWVKADFANFIGFVDFGIYLLRVIDFIYPVVFSIMVLFWIKKSRVSLKI